MFGPTDGQWRWAMRFMIVGAIASALAVLVGVPWMVYWLATHVTVR